MVIILLTDEGQPRPKYIFNKCGTNIYFFLLTEVWSITITKLKKQSFQNGPFKKHLFSIFQCLENDSLLTPVNDDPLLTNVNNNLCQRS